MPTKKDMFFVQGELEEAFANFQALINDNPQDFRPYLCQVSRMVHCFATVFLHFFSPPPIVIESLLKWLI